jgi:hypothetical protein
MLLEVSSCSFENCNSQSVSGEEGAPLRGVRDSFACSSQVSFLRYRMLKVIRVACGDCRFHFVYVPDKLWRGNGVFPRVVSWLVC